MTGAARASGAAPCSIGWSQLAGWEALTLENGQVRVEVLPGKGADIYSMVDLETGVDVLFKTPWGLSPPGSAPRQGSGGTPFLQNYEGGWQELFPSASDACEYRGQRIPFHGEVAALPWSTRVLADRPEEVAVLLSVDCVATPLRLERVMRVSAGSGRLVLAETAINRGDDPAHVVWGHHCVLGPPFLEAGCELDIPATELVTLADLWEDSARLAPGQRRPWPAALGRDGRPVDLRAVPGPEAGSHDDVYLTGLREGRVSVRNPRLGRTFTITFDAALFRWVVSWQPYGGAVAMPLTGCYALGVEPWVSSLDLARAAEAGEAVMLGPGGRLSTVVTAEVT